MASVRKRKWTYKGVTKEAWVVTYIDPRGRQRQGGTFDKKKDADRERQRIEAEIEAGTHTALNESVTVEVASREFFQECIRRRTIGDITRGAEKNYHERLARFITRFGKSRVSKVASEEVQDWIDDLRLTYAASTIQGDYKSVVALLSFCVKRRWVRRNILRDQPCKLPVRARRKAIPSKADIRALLETTSHLKPGENISTMVNRCLVVTCGIFAGLRSGETYGLQWEDIDWERGQLHIRHSYTRVNGLRRPKTEAGERVVPMVPPIERALLQAARYWTLRRSIFGDSKSSQNLPAIHARLANAWDRGSEHVMVDLTKLSGFVVLSRLGTPMEATASATYFWNKLMQDAGLTTETVRNGKAVHVNKFTPHALRHAAASLLLEHGMDDFNLQRFIGHASISTTKDVYGHLMTDRRVLTTTDAIVAEFDMTSSGQRLLTN